MVVEEEAAVVNDDVVVEVVVGAELGLVVCLLPAEEGSGVDGWRKAAKKEERKNGR